ncbi:MAG: TonB-dependent receptor [Rikenellaceae bacterium]
MKNRTINGVRWLLISALTLFVTLQTTAQTITVSGLVSDKSGQTIIGATAMIKGSTNGTTTGIDGTFTLAANSGDVIVVNYIGYMEFEATATADMKIVLAEDVKVIDDVVVIGYGTVRKKEITGAVASVKSDDLTKQMTSDLGSSLQGMVSGVSVTAESGAPGAGSTILIRGVSSISGDNTPLYVVDGVPQEGDPRISPNEIETIDILKDAASCAIYGTRGASGVILITTKRGKEGDLKVSVDASYGFKQITSDNYLMNTTEQTYFNLAYKRALSPDTYDNDFTLDLSKADSYFNNDTNLLGEIFVDNAKTQSYTATVSGGGANLVYSLVAGYTSEEGSIINSSYNRFNTRLNLGYSKDKLTMNVSAGLTNEFTAYSPSGIIVQAIKYFPTQPEFTGDTYYTVGGDEQTNISSILESLYTEDEQDETTTYVNYNFTYELLKGLNLSGRAAINRNSGTRVTFRPYNKIMDSDNVEISDAEDSYIQNKNSEYNSFTWDFGAQYKRDFDKHHLTLLATMTGEEYKFEGYTARMEGVLDNDIKVLNGGSINPEASSSSSYVNKLIGSIGRVQYDWDSRYLLSASVRVDGSSKFASENRWGVFPSASAAWNVSDEPFFEPLTTVVNNFKLRASYGTTGNQNFSAYTYAATIASGYDYVTGTGTTQNLALGSTQSSYSNADVKWETSRQYNFGVDFGLFQNRLTISAEYYKTDKSDMLFPVTLPGSAGSASTVTLNVGDMTNQGVEVSANYRTNIGKLNIVMGGTFSTNDNVITSMTGDSERVVASTVGLVSGAVDYSTCTYFAKGYAAGALFLYPTNGIINTDEKLAEYQKLDSTAEYGDLMFVDSNGDGVWNDDDRQYMGSGLPDYEIGFNLTMDYKGFDFYMNIYSALGHELMNGARATAYGNGRHKDLLGAYSEWNTDSVIPTYRGGTKEHNNYRADSDLWLEDGSYMRIKNITLGYTLPQRVLSKIKVSKLRFYIMAQNLFTLTGYTGYDPEIGGGIATRAMDTGNYPTLATYMGGANLSF